jgi:hypothetical protein
MRESVKKYVQRLNTRNFTNNVQRVLFQLLVQDGEGWVSSRSFRVKSADSRLRDLRKPAYGAFNVICKREEETTKYRVAVRDLTVAKLRQVFRTE